MFVSQSGSNTRFSLLLLDEGEYYFEDFGVFYYPTSDTMENSVKKKQKGRIKLCSKSILFEPEDTRYPISKFPFDHVVGCGKGGGDLAKIIQTNEIFLIRSEQRIDMKENGQNYPYKFSKDRCQYAFSLQFETLLNFLPKIQNLLRISQLPINEHERQLSELIDNHESSILFNHTWLINISEKTQIELTALKITPLVNNPGRIVVTDYRLYFQSLNNVGVRPVDNYELSHIHRIYKRRYSLRHVGLEIFFRNNTSLYLSFKNQMIRNRVYDTILQQNCVPKLPPNDFENMTQKWRQRELSNYDYLLYLNNQAHRSFNDLTQYPVFPWIIADYNSSELDMNNPKTFRDLSKPIGALNSDRLAGLVERFKMMSGIPDQKPFLYGTHYSTPGYVLYYLVRKAPEYMLRLQNGRFDSPNRMFHSIKETWEGVLINPSDVKEVIPEFYTESAADFLVNSEGLKLGVRQNGELLDDVILPAWASSPIDFIRKSREALESEFVSSHLHLWIDLIFGFKQTGDEAIKANNVFYPLTYEGAVDIEKINDPMERKSIEAQINEFGQTPHLLFSQPHPSRLPPGAKIEPENNNQQLKNDSKNNRSVDHHHHQNKIKNDEDEKEKAEKKRQMDESFNLIFGHSFSSPVLQNRNNNNNNNANDFNLDDNSSFYSTQSSSSSSSSSSNSRFSKNWNSSFQSFTPSFNYKLHKEGITGIELSKNEETLYSVSSDGSLKFFNIDNQRLSRSIQICDLTLSSICYADHLDRIFMGSWDNHIYVYSVEFGRLKENIYAHDDAVSCVKVKGDLMVSGSWDSTIKLWNLNSSSSSSLYQPIFDCSENCSQIRAIDLSNDTNLCFAGTQDGNCIFFDKREPHFRSFRAHDDAINQIMITSDSRNIITCSDDSKVKIFDIFSKSLIHSFSLPSSILSFDSDGRKFVGGLKNGSYSVIDLKTGSILGSLKDKQCSPITSIRVSNDGKYFISGASDAMISIWNSP